MRENLGRPWTWLEERVGKGKEGMQPKAGAWLCCLSRAGTVSGPCRQHTANHGQVLNDAHIEPASWPRTSQQAMQKQWVWAAGTGPLLG